MDQLLQKIKNDPFGSLTRCIFKLLIAPIKYGKNGGYDAKQYWSDRLHKYGYSLKGVGDEGLSEEENADVYAKAAEIFQNILQIENIDFHKSNVLEIGPGTGFYTQILKNLGIIHYTGVDITDALFLKLKEKFPEYTFVQHDVTEYCPEGQYDLIVMIDVIEHIVTEEKFSSAMQNIRKRLKKGGVFLVCPVMTKTQQFLFNVKMWSKQDIEALFDGFAIGQLIPYRNGNILSIKNAQ